MSKYIYNEQGKWLIEGILQCLVEPSDEYISEQERLEQERLEQELINNLKPTPKEVLMAEIELEVVNLLIESEVL